MLNKANDKRLRGDDNVMEERIELSGPQRALLASLEPRNLFMAGVGSGKTHLLGLKAGMYARMFPFLRGFIGANTYGQLSKSTLSRVFDVWASAYGWRREIDYVVDRRPPADFVLFGEPLKKYDNTISLSNGCLIFVGGLENYMAFDGMEFGWADLDETKDTKEEAVKDVILARLRQPGVWRDGNKLFTKERRDKRINSGLWKLVKDDSGELSTINTNTGAVVRGWNPLSVFTTPAKVAWLNNFFDITDHTPEIKSKIFSKTEFYHGNHDGKTVVISSTYHNQHNLPANYIAELIKTLAGDEEKVNRLVYASPISKGGGEWLGKFSQHKHVEPCHYDPTLPLHITFDFNVNPYMTMLVFQIHEANEHGIIPVKFLQEYCLESPKNTTHDCCVEFMFDYSGHDAGVFYYGDPSGKNRSPLSKEMKHHYDVVESVMFSMLVDGSKRVIKSAPPLVKRRDFSNAMLFGSLGVEVRFDPSMKNTIQDFEFLKEGRNGGYVKKIVKNKETGQSYEEMGHCCDAWGYGMIGAFLDMFQQVRAY